jgi:signal transduction histidine kinase
MDILRQTVVTVAHYINNPLTALAMQAQVGLKKQGESEFQDVLRFIEMKVDEISAVIGILQDMASPRSITYLGEVKMIDIQTELERKLEQIEEKYKV